MATNIFYTNPLAVSKDYPYQLRWMGGRQASLALSNCCPPNTVRTMAEVSNYVYSLSDSFVQVNFYGGSELDIRTWNGRTSYAEAGNQLSLEWQGKDHCGWIASRPFCCAGAYSRLVQAI